MMIFKKAIPRRTFLRGMGATLALPLLDGMVPAMAAAQNTPARPATRLGIVYVPNGIIMDKWTPAAEGAAFELTPILEPLAPFRDRLLVLSGLNQNEARQLPGEAAGDHPRACAAFLTGVHARQTSGVDIRAGESVDQVAAKELGKQTQLASLELGIENAEVVGSCIAAYSCAYSNTFCWSTPTTPLPMENEPRAVFERLFGDNDSTDPAVRRVRNQEDRSILDFATREVSHLVAAFGPNDRSKLTEYLDSIRDIERRIRMTEEQSSRELPTLNRPAGLPATFTEHAKIMLDLQALAFQVDLTRVFSFVMARETSTRVYTELGLSEGHHPLSHHQGDKIKIAAVEKINLLHTQMLAYFLGKLQTTPDGDGSILDHSMIVYGAGLSDGNLHAHYDLPTLVVGGGGGRLKTGRHLRYPQDTPMTNLYLTMMDKLGIQMEKFGDSSGKLDFLSAV